MEKKKNNSFEKSIRSYQSKNARDQIKTPRVEEKESKDEKFERSKKILNRLLSSVESEKPIKIVIAQSRLSLFAESFNPEADQFDDKELLNFIFACSDFTHERFNQLLSLIELGDYLLIPKFYGSLIIGYLYKGSSASASRRLDAFHQKLKKYQIWPILVRNNNCSNLNPLDLEILKIIADYVFLTFRMSYFH